MKALYIGRHAPFRNQVEKLQMRLNCPVATLEAKDNAAGHAFIDAHPNLTLVIIGFNDADRDPVGALRQPIIQNIESKVVAFPKPGSVSHAPKATGQISADNTSANNASTDNTSCDNSRVRDDVLQLTPRQDEVLSLLRLGLSNKEIARKLDVAESTVKFHCIAIFRHLGVSNRTQAAIRAEEFAPHEPA